MSITDTFITHYYKLNKDSVTENATIVMHNTILGCVICDAVFTNPYFLVAYYDGIGSLCFIIQHRYPGKLILVP